MSNILERVEPGCFSNSNNRSTEPCRNWTKWGIVFDLASRRASIGELQQQTEETGFWDNPDAAQEHMKKISALQRVLEPWDELQSTLADLQVLAEMALEEDDESQEDELQTGLVAASGRLEKLKLEFLFNGRYDDNSAILSVNAGAGGTEACDWAEMVLRMYQRYAEANGWEFSVVSSVDGDAAGIRNATATVNGFRAYGLLKAEVGVHRLVRISPYDSSKRRHTSFASVDVIPQIEENDDSIEIDPEDLRVDTYRSSGAGGQHVNKTDSAVRITHIPTGTVVQCQNERSQMQNRHTAMTLLKARLAEKERRRRQEELAKLRGTQMNIDFGSQIRSYVLQPYTMVKDHRTNVENSQVQAVLDGDLDEFITAYLQTRAAKGEFDEDDA